jgi:hypothetical protein
MTRAAIAGGAFATVLVLLPLAVGNRALERDADLAAATSRATTEGLLYGRVTTVDGAVYEGRLRFGGDEEAFWDHYFNGAKDGNRWAAQVPPERLKERVPIEIFGVRIGRWAREIDLGRPFMARFGDIARLDARGRDLRVTLKSGMVVELDRFAADDFADGVRVWDDGSGVVDLGERRIRTIEFLSTPRLDAAPDRLYGTVRTRHGDFTGFVQWDRKASIGSDQFEGHTADGGLSLRFAAIRSIARRSPDSSRVTLLDGREILLSDVREGGRGNRGIYVDDPLYGRVLVSWDAFDRVDFGPGGGGPAYGDFPPGRPLTGSVTTRAGLRLAGRLVYDLDESETTETLDAPSQGVDYTIPLGLVASIVPLGPQEDGAGGARVILHSGEELELERAGDLGEGNAGMLVFLDGRQRPQYVSWTDVQQIDFDRPPAMYPASGPR